MNVIPIENVSAAMSRKGFGRFIEDDPISRIGCLNRYLRTCPDEKVPCGPGHYLIHDQRELAARVTAESQDRPASFGVPVSNRFFDGIQVHFKEHANETRKR